MHDVLRERIWRHMEALPEERLYQVLDYIEFLSSKYAREAVRPASGVQRFGERLEDKLRGNGVGLGALRGTLEVVGTADRMMTGLADAGRSILREVSGGEPPRPRSAPPRDGARNNPNPPSDPVIIDD